MSAKKWKTKMTALAINEVHRGTNAKGSDYVIYEVQAVGEDGQEIDQTLRTFHNLGEKGLINKLVEYDVEQYDHEKYGTSYTITPPKSGGGSLGPKVDELRDQLNDLEARVAALEAGGNGGSQSQATAPAAGAGGRPMARGHNRPPDTPAPTSDDDIPF